MTENNSSSHEKRFIFSDNYYRELGSIDESNSVDNHTTVPSADVVDMDEQSQIMDFKDPKAERNLIQNSEVESQTLSEEQESNAQIETENKAQVEAEVILNSSESAPSEELLQSIKSNPYYVHELLKSHSDIIKPKVVANTWNEDSGKNVYRAKRNPIRKNPIWETVESISSFQKASDVPTPNIIYIEENLKEESDDMVNIQVTTSNLKAELSNLFHTLLEKEKETGKISMIARYGEDFCSKDYITNPAIGRDKEIKELILILLTPEKSGILVGKPGIGKTSIVEGLAYKIQRNQVPTALQGYRVISVKTTSLIGTLSNGETKLQTLIDELKELDKIILFIDEVHMLMGAKNESGLDFANMFKESLGRGDIKMIGATTSDEYERYVLRDKAFVRRFQRVDVEEPTREETVAILMGTLPKIEKQTGAKLLYTNYLQQEILTFIVDITTEYKRIYGIGSRYPDICLTLLTQAFSEATFENRTEVTIYDIRKAIQNSKNIYPDVIQKELINFDQKFRDLMS